MKFCQLLTVLPFVAGILGKPLESRASSTTTTDFTIYAYGPNGVGGYPVIAINNAAYIATDSWAYSNSSARNVTFDSPDTKGNFTASFDSGSGGSLLYVPSSSGDVGFTNSTSSSSQITTGFGFYGHVIYVTINGTMITQWGAVPTIDSSLWKLVWNSGDDGVFPIALRNIAPS